MKKLNNEEKTIKRELNSKIQTINYASNSKFQTQNSEFHYGITLVALVVTIVVLLILAGITINLLLGPNSIFNSARKSSLETKLSTIEEAAGLIYSDLKLQKYQGNVEDITMEDIVEKLEEQGFKIETRQVGENAVTGIVIEPKQVSITENRTAKVTVNLKTAGEGMAYYTIIDGQYYQMYPTGSGVAVDREPKNPDGAVIDGTVEIVKNYDTSIVANIENNENELTLTGGTGTGSTKVNIKYGKITDSFEVTMNKKATSITAKAMILVEETSNKIGITTDPVDAGVNLKYTTEDTEKITVSEDGTVIAKNLNGKQTDTATVTITDAITGKTATCIVTIESVVGTYIEYDVSYTDMYNGVNFTKENGWRLLNYEKNSEGTYSNIELISTGIPANLDYHYNISDNNEWFITEDAKLKDFKILLRER